MDAVNAVSFALLQDQLRSVLATLSEREASIVRLRFGLTDGHPRTLDEMRAVISSGATRASHARARAARGGNDERAAGRHISYSLFIFPLLSRANKTYPAASQCTHAPTCLVPQPPDAQTGGWQ